MSKKRFIYHGYLQIAELDVAATESAMPVLRKTYLWDPLEPAATRIAAALTEPAKVALAAGAIAAAGRVAIVSKESLQRSIMRSGVKVKEILKELKHRKGMWICYVRGSNTSDKRK